MNPVTHNEGLKEWATICAERTSNVQEKNRYLRMLNNFQGGNVLTNLFAYQLAQQSAHLYQNMVAQPAVAVAAPEATSVYYASPSASVVQTASMPAAAPGNYQAVQVQPQASVVYQPAAPIYQPVPPAPVYQPQVYYPGQTTYTYAAPPYYQGAYGRQGY